MAQTNEKSTSKKKILTSALAIALAAVMLTGGTYAYLQDETGEVVNDFKTNQVLVDLTETTGTEYDIIPGTYDSKDPTVTVTATVDTYVFVKVTDDTEGLIDFKIDDSWKKAGSYENVWYQKIDYVAPTAAEGEEASTEMTLELPVLAKLDGEHEIYYHDDITNSDMVTKNADGSYTFKEGFALTFKAFAVQAQPWVDDAEHTDDENAAAAYIRGKFVTNEQELSEALNAGENAIFGNDIEIKDHTVQAIANTSSVIDLNGHKMYRTNDGVLLAVTRSDSELTVVNGTAAHEVPGNIVAYAVNGNNVNLENVGIEADYGLYNIGGTIQARDITVTSNGNGVSVYSGGSVELENAAVTSGVDGVYVCQGTAELTNVSVDAGAQGVVAIDGSTVNMTNCEVEADQGAGIQVGYQDMEGCTVNVTGGKLTNVHGGVYIYGNYNYVNLTDLVIRSDTMSVYQNGSYSPNWITIQNCDIEDSSVLAIYISNTDDAGSKQNLTISGSTVKGSTAVELKHTDAVITDSTLIATSAEQTVSASPVGGGNCADGYPLALTSNENADNGNPNVPASGTVTLNGNSYVREAADGVDIYNHRDGATVTVG